MPVVILDGFDELLQATGMNRADYLDQIRQFQQREEELDRLVAVLVTSRTVVADRARFPDNTVVLRIERFDEPQVRAWLDVWNAHNVASLTARGGGVILEAELNDDIPHLLWEADLRPAHADSANRALTVSQLMVGRFFFIQESRATRDTGGPERSFEFLHATFGDFLVSECVRGRVHGRRRHVALTGG